MSSEAPSLNFSNFNLIVPDGGFQTPWEAQGEVSRAVLYAIGIKKIAAGDDSVATLFEFEDRKFVAKFYPGTHYAANYRPKVTPEQLADYAELTNTFAKSGIFGFEHK